MSLFKTAQAVKKVEAVGPHACGSCTISSCFRDKLQSVPIELERKLEQLRGFIVETDVAYRKGDLQAAKLGREKVYSLLKNLINGAKNQDEMDSLVFSVESMMDNHKGTGESLQFLLKER